MTESNLEDGNMMTDTEIRQKYQKSYHLPPVMSYDWVKKDAISAPPIWCSVDLRDGNQALIDPMDLESKIAFFRILTDIGFKEIEVGFPASSDTEYQFIRALIERNMIPEDVTIQVLTQAREHIIKKTFEAVIAVFIAAAHSEPGTISLGAVQQIKPLSSRCFTTISEISLSFEL